MSDVVTRFADSGRAVAGLVARIPDDDWAGPGLGEWTLRDLVGHASRSLVTVIDYLARPVDVEEVGSPVGYLAAIGSLSGDAAAIVERGRQAGHDLGPDPGARFAELVDEAVRVAAAADPGAVVHTIAGGMRVAAYLPTRTFELCVHGLDIAAATGLPLDLPATAVEEAAVLAAQAAVHRGDGPDLLLALTGRPRLPDGFSVV
jgi:uncharacterized protein (TIGR03083 family)